MKTVVKKLLTMVLVLSMVCGVALSKPQYASAKTTSKVTKVVTVMPKKWVIHKLSTISEDCDVRVKVKILSVKGKTTLSGEDLMWGDKSGFGKGPVFAYYSKPPLKRTSFKKGNVLISDADMPLHGGVYVLWDAPKGIKKLKIQLTYYTENGKAGIKSVRKVKSRPL